MSERHYKIERQKFKQAVTGWPSTFVSGSLSSPKIEWILSQLNYPVGPLGRFDSRWVNAYYKELKSHGRTYNYEYSGQIDYATDDVIITLRESVTADTGVV